MFFFLIGLCCFNLRFCFFFRIFINGMWKNNCIEKYIREKKVNRLNLDGFCVYVFSINYNSYKINL